VCEGYASGSKYNQAGNGGNYLCLPEEPQWKNYLEGHQSHTGRLSGVEYELFNSGSARNNIFSEANNGGADLVNNPAPCAVCYVQSRSTVLMIPARTQCPDGWSVEYAGYLVSNRYQLKSSSYICLDEAPETATGAMAQNHALFYPVEVECGTLPCSVYIGGRELSCVVCSK